MDVLVPFLMLQRAVFFDSSTSRTRTRVVTDFVERGDVLWHLETLAEVNDSTSTVSTTKPNNTIELERILSTLILSAVLSCAYSLLLLHIFLYLII